MWQEGATASIDALADPGMDFSLKEIRAAIEMAGSRVSLELSAKMVFNKLELDVAAQLPACIFEATLGEPSPETADAQHQLVSSFLQARKKEPPPKGAGPRGIALKALELMLAPRQRSVLIHFAVDNLFTLAPFTLKAVQADMIYAAGNKSGRLWTDLEIALGENKAPIELLLVAELDPSGAWQFEGRTGPAGVKLSDLLAALEKLFTTGLVLPRALTTLDIVELSLAYNTDTKTSAFSIEVQLSVDETPVDVAVSVCLKSGDASATTIKATIHIGPYEFELKFDQETGSDKKTACEQNKDGDQPVKPGAVPETSSTFVAAFETTDKADFSGLVQSLTTNKEVLDLIPSPLEIGLKNAVFAFRSQTGQPSQYLFGISLDLSGAKLDLSKLPVVGGEFKGSVGLDSLQILVANQEISRSQVGVYNAILAQPAGPSGAAGAAARPEFFLPAPRPNAPAPEKDTIVGRGFNFAAVLNLGPAGTFPLFSGARITEPAPKQTLSTTDKEAPSSGSTPKKPPAVITPVGNAPIPRDTPTSSADDATWFEVQKTLGPVKIEKVGARYRESRVWLLLSGSLSAGPITLELQGLGLGFKLTELDAPEFSLDGLGLSYASGPLQISGAFLKSPMKDAQGNAILDHNRKPMVEYAGVVKVQAQAFSIVAMGAYGTMEDGTPTLFIYGVMSAAAGKGITLGPITITALALGFGINRSVVIPLVGGVKDFPLVKMVMGPDPDHQSSVALPAPSSPAEALAQLSSALRAQQGQFFGAIGLQFTLFQTIDCFALAIVQGGNDLEISILGVGRYKKPMCAIEIDILIDLKPAAGVLKVDAILTNSWVLDKNCALTGNFALYMWFDGEHKGDFVISLGGYHPSFVVPAHYPVVPRLALNWQINSEVSAKGEFYFAITPSSFMAGGRLEACYRSGDVGADFVAEFDILIQWKPLHYSVHVGIRISAYVNLGFLGSPRFEVSVDLLLQGPPMYGTARVGIGPVDVTIEFGAPPIIPPTLEAWPEFGRSFLDRTNADGTAADADDISETGKWERAILPDKPIRGPILHQLLLVKGQIAKAGAQQQPPGKSGAAELWMVRGDELELCVTAVIPATTLQWGKSSAPRLIELPIPPDDAWSGTPLTVDHPMDLGVRPAKDGTLGIRLMRQRDVDTPIRIAVLRKVTLGSGQTVWEDDSSTWAFERDRSAAVPAAIWGNPLEPDDAMTPSAETIRNCLTGLRHIKPPVAHSRGDAVGPIKSKDLRWDDLVRKTVGLDTNEQPGPTERNERPHLKRILEGAADRRQRIASALKAAGFEEAADFQPAGATFRPLYAAPLAAAATMETPK